MKAFKSRKECIAYCLENYTDPQSAWDDEDWCIDFDEKLTLDCLIEEFKNKHTDLDSKQQLEQRVVESFGQNVEVSGDKIKLRVDPSSFVVVKSDEKPNKYIRNLKGVECDVYDVLKAFDVTCPALQHLIKKALCAGLRGHKDKSQDLKDILDSAKRAIELNDSEVK